MHITLVNYVKIVLTWYKTESHRVGKVKKTMYSMILCMTRLIRRKTEFTAAQF